jgi:hypothetical protein
MKVLFLNNTHKQCGVYQYGSRLYDILQDSPIDKKIENTNTSEIRYIYKEIGNYSEYVQILQEHTDVEYVIYNYHHATIPWLNPHTIQKRVKNIGIIHESSGEIFDIVIQIDLSFPENGNQFSIPRPIFENIDFSQENIVIVPTRKEFIDKYQETNIPIFGSFGFGFQFKGFDKVIQMVNEQYEEAIIKFVIPIAHHDSNRNRIHEINQCCFDIPRKPGIQLMISNEFFTNIELLQFLGSNTMNIFLYDTLHDRSISSTIDYALSVKKPLGISDSHMFRHIYADEICLYKTPIATIMKNSVEYCRTFLDKYSNKNMRTKIKDIVEVHKLDIVLQGPANSYTLEIANHYLCLPFVNNIIISCWEGDSIFDTYNSKIILLKNKNIPNSGCGNRNFQIKSSLEGLKLVKCNFAVKLRSDQKIGLNSMYAMFHFYNKHKERELHFHNNPSKPKNKICVAGIFRPFPFHPRDHIFWGNTQDLIDIFNIPYCDDNYYKEFDNVNDNILYKQTIRTEAYIAVHYYAKFEPKIDLFINNYKSYLVDDAPLISETFKVNDEIITKVFKPFPKIDLEWPKYNLSNYHYDYTEKMLGEYWSDETI